MNIEDVYFKVNIQALTDAPYQAGNEDIFKFDASEIASLENNLIYGNPGCYLVSGYRGSGKTSFINKVILSITERYSRLNYKNGKRNGIDQFNKDSKGFFLNQSYERIFVKCSYAGYSNQTAFLRHLFRGLYLSLKSSAIEDKCQFDFLSSETKDEISKLYNRTFFRVSDQYTLSEETATVQERKFNFDFALVAKMFDAAVLITLTQLSFILFFNDASSWFKLAYFFSIPIVWFIGSWQVSKNYVSKKAVQSKTVHDELYDDEIAFFYFDRLLAQMQTQGFRVVFILDELDKVADSEMDKLINEMKPFLLRGTSDFVVVAGQKLTHRYINSVYDDDSIISSIFSFNVHVALKDVNELRDLIVERIIIDADEYDGEDAQRLEQYITSVIFRSKHVVRSAISLIRRDLVWRDGIAYLDTGRMNLDFMHDTVRRMESLIVKSIDPEGHAKPLRDYLISQCYRFANMWMSNKQSMNKDYVELNFKSSTHEHDSKYYHLVFPHLMSLSADLGIFSQAKNEDVFVEPHAEDDDYPRNALDSVVDLVSVKEADALLSAFRQDFNQFIYLLNIACDGYGFKQIGQPITGLEAMNILVDRQVVEFKVEDKMLQSVFQKPSLLNDPSILKDSHRLFYKSGLNMNVTLVSIFEKLAMLKVSEVFTLANWEPIREWHGSDRSFDFVIKGSLSLPDVIVEFRFLKRGFEINYSPSAAIEGLRRYNKLTKRGNFFLLIVVTGSNNDDEFNNAFDNAEIRYMFLLRSIDSSLYDKVRIIICSASKINELSNSLSKVVNDIAPYDLK